MITNQFDGFHVTIRTMASYTSAFLNGDDAGMQKMVMMSDGTLRTMVSAAKYKHEFEHSEEVPYSLATMDAPQSVQSREIFDRLVYQKLQDTVEDRELVLAATAGLMAEADLLRSGDGESSKNMTKTIVQDIVEDVDTQVNELLHLSQTVILGEAEIENIRQEVARKIRELGEIIDNPGEQVDDILKVVTDWPKDLNERIQGMLTAGIRGMLCGRMSTSALKQIRSSLSVGDAIGTHEMAKTGNYTSASDDLKDGDADSDNGSGFIGTQDRVSPLLFRDISLNVPSLSSNVSGVGRRNWRAGDEDLVCEIVRRLVLFSAMANPACKHGSTHPDPLHDMVMVQIGPYTMDLRSAFSPAVDPYPDPLVNSLDALEQKLDDVTMMYGRDHEYAFSGMSEVKPLAEKYGDGLVPVDELAEWTASKVREAYHG